MALSSLGLLAGRTTNVSSTITLCVEHSLEDLVELNHPELGPSSAAFFLAPLFLLFQVNDLCSGTEMPAHYSPHSLTEDGFGKGD